jgi:hypothetical protein
MSETRTLLLDGFIGRPWRWEKLLRTIRQRVGPAEIFHYDMSGRSRFETLGAQLAAQIRRHDQPVNLIGFSMGGLVIRAAHLHDPTLPIQRAVLLNSPLRGSLLAYALPIGGIRQMRPSDEFLRRVKNTPWNIPTLVTWCPGDTAVIPGRSARWPAAQETICCSVPMHIWPVYSPGIHRRIVEFLAAESIAKVAS